MLQAVDETNAPLPPQPIYVGYFSVTNTGRMEGYVDLGAYYAVAAAENRTEHTLFAKWKYNNNEQK